MQVHMYEYVCVSVYSFHCIYSSGILFFTQLRDA